MINLSHHPQRPLLKIHPHLFDYYYHHFAVDLALASALDSASCLKRSTVSCLRIANFVDFITDSFQSFLPPCFHANDFADDFAIALEPLRTHSRARPGTGFCLGSSRPSCARSSYLHLHRHLDHPLSLTRCPHSYSFHPNICLLSSL